MCEQLIFRGRHLSSSVQALCQRWPVLTCTCLTLISVIWSTFPRWWLGEFMMNSDALLSPGWSGPEWAWPLIQEKLLYPAAKTNKSNYINGVHILHTRGKLDPDELHVKATHQCMDYITSFGTTLWSFSQYFPLNIPCCCVTMETLVSYVLPPRRGIESLNCRVHLPPQLVSEQQESRPLLSPSIDDFLCETKCDGLSRPVTSNTAGTVQPRFPNSQPTRNTFTKTRNNRLGFHMTETSITGPLTGLIPSSPSNVSSDTLCPQWPVQTQYLSQWVTYLFIKLCWSVAVNNTELERTETVHDW